MTLEQYWTVLVKQWKLIAICFLVAGLGTFTGSKLITPVYQSTALVQVAVNSSNNQADYNSLLASDELVQTEAILAVSSPVLHEVASHYPGLTVEQLAKEVTAVPKPNTQLFEIDVLDPSPTGAAAMANDIATTLIKHQLQEIQQDNSQSQQQIQQDLQQTLQQITTIRSQLAALQGKKGDDVQINALKAQQDTLQQHYSAVQTALAQLELTQAQNGSFLRVAQPAQVPLSPAKPNVLLNTAAGFLTGLFLGLLLVVLFEQLDTRVRTVETLTQLVEWPLLGTVWRPEDKDEALVNPQGHSANGEAYRILRTNIGFAALDKPLHSIMVTSPLPHDGKSTIAANLAIFMAKAGKNTLLIDADMRRATMHEKFNLSADRQGLSNAIVACSQAQFAPALSPIQRLSTPLPPQPSFSLAPYMHTVNIPNLRVMPSGPLPPNPSELLASKAIEHFFSALANCGAEIVIFDTPPLLGLSDASILAPKVDGTVVVVDITTADKKNLKQLKDLLLQAGANVLGCVVNKQSRSRKNHGYYYYYYYRKEEGNGQHSTSNGNGSHAAAQQVLSRSSEWQ